VNKQLDIYGIHKSGTCLQHKIYKYINAKLGYDCILFNRFTARDDLSNVNVSFITARHPLNKLISQYYSFGWSHTVRRWDENQIRIRNKIRGLTLDEYITDPRFQELTTQVYNIAYQHIDKIIKYEDIMKTPQKFINLILREINQEDLFDEVWGEFADEFVFNEPDLSDRIINEDLKVHRRNLDHDEYKKKLLPETINNLSSEFAEVIKKYDNISQT
jgi:hypothetical protein